MNTDIIDDILMNLKCNDVNVLYSNDPRTYVEINNNSSEKSRFSFKDNTIIITQYDDKSHYIEDNKDLIKKMFNDFYILGYGIDRIIINLDKEEFSTEFINFLYEYCDNILFKKEYHNMIFSISNDYNFDTNIKL